MGSRQHPDPVGHGLRRALAERPRKKQRPPLPHQGEVRWSPVGVRPEPPGLPGQGRAGWERDEGLVSKGDFLKPREQTLLSWHALLLRCSAYQAR